MLSKVGWRLLHDRESLWARVLQAKYNVGDVHDQSWLRGKGNWSSTWRSVGVGLRDVVVSGLSWVLGDGRLIRFWKDKWLLNTPLLETVTRILPDEEADVCVRDLWRNGLGWDLVRIMPFVSHDIRLILAPHVVDDLTGAKDKLSWGERSDGNFSVKSAYYVLCRDENPRPMLGNFFERVWKVVAPERVRVFIWLVGHQVIMTNVERQRKHLSDTGLCQICKSGDKTIIHVLRDCPAMDGIWRRLVDPRKVQAFFSMSLLEWLYGNLGDSGNIDGTPWTTVFTMTIWWGWKWRCENIFGVNGKCRDRVWWVKELAKEVSNAHLICGNNSGKGVREVRLIAWKPPGNGWFKLNMDGASHGNTSLATAGGVLRDKEGAWCSGFALNIRICSALLAELWGVYYGLYIAWERGITCLELEVDSEIVVGFLKTGISDAHPLSFLVRLCYDFISRDWRVRISHVYREANRLADGLANYVFSLPLGFHSLEVMLVVVSQIVSEDVRESTRPHDIRI